MRFGPRFVLPLVLLGLAACANNGTLSEEEEQEQALLAARRALESAADPGEATTAPPPASCDATAVQGLVGEDASEAVVEQARTDAGADSVRTLRPGQAVTLEFNGARLNVEVDEENRIVSLRCG